MRLILGLLILCAAPARAIMAPASARADAKRFGLDRPPVVRKGPSSAARSAFSAFNAAQGGHWKVRFSPRTGLPTSLTGGHDAPHPGRPEDSARAFLSAHADVLGVDPNSLTVERQNQGNGHQHLLFRQSYKGVPVVFAAVKVHLDPRGGVIGVQSTYEPDLSLPTTPAVSAAAAAMTAAADAGGGSVRGAPTLVIVPLDSDGKNHLSWMMRVDGRGGSWRYYVDALTGQVLFRYGAREFIGSSQVCWSSGVVTGSVWDIDPTTTPGPVIRPFNNQYVYISANPVSRALSSPDSFYGGGFFCGQTSGKVAMSLQGPYVSVSEFRGPNSHYDDGNGLWHSAPTPVSSPHPYPNNANISNTINISAIDPFGVEFLPVFQTFSVGNFDGGSGEGSGDIVDDDRLIISDGSNNGIASYIGARGPFNGAAVHGSIMHLNLVSNESGQESGYDISISSYLTLTAPSTDAAPLSSHTWTSADTWISAKEGRNLHGEISLFYHLNLMHDYFTADVDKSSAAPVVKPVVVMAHVGPNLVNAFYDPDYDDLSFGDGPDTNSPSDMFMDDATVPHHEYTHYMVAKIWNLQNYGQAGALSEANADYWSASSLNDPAIGTYVESALGGSGPVRQIDDQAAPVVFYVLGSPTTPWTGEIHSDSLYLSQAMWDIRRASVARLPAIVRPNVTAGQSCADGLVFQALLYFPESFVEMYEDMLAVDALGAVPNCGAANASQNIITNAFAAHGLTPIGGDAYEPNDGFETADDISTIPVVSATIYPIADTDFYSFGAGPGLVQVTMNLPSNGDGSYKDYQLKLFNVSRVQVAAAAPPANGFGTLDGFCDVADCRTTQPSVTMQYNNPAGGLLYVQVIGGDTGLSNSGVNSTVPYTLKVTFPQSNALSGSVVSAHFDHDVIGFNVVTSTFVSVQDWRFATAQLRDQSHNAMPGTLTHIPTQAGDFLLFGSSLSAAGQISGSVQISTGFAARFPSVGTVYLEVFANDQHGTLSSMGESNSINLSDNQTELTAYNNLFNPMLGQKATIKYGVSGAGHLTLKLYTVTGRLVLTLFDGQVTAGKGSIDWNGANAAGSYVASGIYVVRAVGPGLNTTQKIAVIK